MRADIKIVPEIISNESEKNEIRESIEKNLIMITEKVPKRAKSKNVFKDQVLSDEENLKKQMKSKNNKKGENETKSKRGKAKKDEIEIQEYKDEKKSDSEEKDEVDEVKNEVNEPKVRKIDNKKVKSSSSTPVNNKLAQHEQLKGTKNDQTSCENEELSNISHIIFHDYNLEGCTEILSHIKLSNDLFFRANFGDEKKENSDKFFPMKKFEEENPRILANYLMRFVKFKD